VLEREAPLPVRDRRVLARATAAALADRRGCRELADAEPSGEREAVLASFAAALTSTPWKIDQSSIEALRGLGLDDVGVLDVISVASFQNTASRLNHVLTQV
jgi:alkylhydroperoxidase family enzyme